MSERPSPRPDERERDRDLPGLLDWGDVLLEATERAETPAPASAFVRPRPWRTPRRVIQVLAAALVLLVAGVVVATRDLGGDPSASAARVPAVRLVAGTAGDVRWRIDGWNAGDGRVCLRTEAFRDARRALVRQACLTPRTAARLTMAVGSTKALSLIVGTAGAHVSSVRVAPPNGDPVRVAARALSATVLRRSHLREGTRIYVAVFLRAFQRLERAPEVTGYDAGGHTLAAITGIAR